MSQATTEREDVRNVLGIAGYAGQDRLPAAHRKLLSLDRIKPAPWNPPNRCSDEAVRPLAESMSRTGLLYEVLVAKDGMQLIEGHRRVAAARMLGWKTIPAIVVDGDADLIYADVNSTSRKMTGNDALGVWLIRPTAVTKWMQQRFTSMQGDIGRRLVKRLYDEGLSMRTYMLACRIAKYCGAERGDGTVQQVLVWLLDCSQIGQIHKALEVGADPRVILEAVRKMKPIKANYTL